MNGTAGTTGRLLLLALLTMTACARAPRKEGIATSACSSLDAPSCARAFALVRAARTFADEAHDYVLASGGLAAGTGLARAQDGWHALGLECARASPATPRLSLDVVDYAFVGVAVDGTLVSSDADVGPVLARDAPAGHDVRLVAMAFVRDLSEPSFDRTTAILETAAGSCTCNEATHFAGATRYGATLEYAFRAPRTTAWFGRGEPHVRAIDVVRAALADPDRAVRESRVGSLVIDGLRSQGTSAASSPLTFHVTDAKPVARAASPIAELCDFPAPELSPSPIDFGVAPYGTEVSRSVHAVNRAPIELRALLGASTYVVPAGGAVDLPLRWTPEGDAPGCETQTRDEAIPFLRPSGKTARVGRVLETVRTGRPVVSRRERVEPLPPRLDVASSVREWSCPADFLRTACRAEGAGAFDAVAEARGDRTCHFACRGAGGQRASCRFDAVMECALHCPP
jgi:hypothetical protein